MSNLKKTVAFVLAVAGTSLAASPPPAFANGAASTRNIIFGAAAVGAGTFIILNHNAKVHQKYAEKDRLQAQTQEQANEAQAAYESEKQAYGHEAALVSEQQKEIAYQHQVVSRQNAQIASLQHSLQVARADGRPAGTKFVQTASRPGQGAPPVANAPQHLDVAQTSFSNVSYGWGTY